MRVRGLEENSRYFITRAPELDFKDDRSRFLMYKYKDRLHISQLHKYGQIFLCIRPDYFQKGKDCLMMLDREDRLLCVDKYNPCRSFILEEFIRDCEYILNKLDSLVKEEEKADA